MRTPAIAYHVEGLKLTESDNHKDKRYNSSRLHSQLIITYIFPQNYEQNF